MDEQKDSASLTPAQAEAKTPIWPWHDEDDAIVVSMRVDDKAAYSSDTKGMRMEGSKERHKKQ